MKRELTYATVCSGVECMSLATLRTEAEGAKREINNHQEEYE